MQVKSVLLQQLPAEGLEDPRPEVQAHGGGQGAALPGREGKGQGEEESLVGV